MYVKQLLYLSTSRSFLPFVDAALHKSQRLRGGTVHVLDCTIPLTYTGSWNVIFSNDIQSLGPASSMMIEVFLFTITTASTIQFPLLLISKNKTVCKVFSS